MLSRWYWGAHRWLRLKRDHRERRTCERCGVEDEVRC